jgi:hypothetical protein
MFLQHNAPSDLFIIQAALDLLWGGEGGSYDILIAYIDDPVRLISLLRRPNGRPWALTRALIGDVQPYIVGGPLSHCAI